MKKLISLLVVAAFALTLVPVAKADQISDLMALIASLQAQIAALQGAPATTGTTCFANNLKLGMTHADVKLLQEKLGVINTGYFGPLTLAAVKTFQTANGVPNTGFVGTLTRAQLNAKYCSTTTVTTAPVGGAMSISLAADNAPAANVQKGSANNAILKLVFVGGATATNVTGLTLQSYGTTAATGDTDITAFKLYDESGVQLGTNRTSAGNAVNFVIVPALTVAANSTRTVTVTADVSATTTNVMAVARYGIASATAVTGGTFVASYPVIGNAFTIVPAGQLGAVNATKFSVVPKTSVKIGANDVILGRYNVAAGSNEDITVNQITVTNNGGTISDSDLSNLRIRKAGGEVITGSASLSNKKATFVLTTPITLVKGASVNLELIGNIANGNARTIIMEIGVGGVIARGVTSGTNMTNAAATGSDTITIGLGTLTVSMSANHPQGANGYLIKTTNLKTLAAFSMRANGENIILNTIDLTFVDGTDALTTSNYLSSVGLYDGDSLVSNLINVDDHNAQQFSLNWTVPADTTKELTVKGITNTLTATGDSVVTTFVASAGYGLSSGEAINNTADVVTTAITIYASGVTSVSDETDATRVMHNQNILAPMVNAPIGAIKIYAQREDMKLTDWKVYVSSSNHDDGADISSVTIYDQDGTTQLSNPVAFDTQDGDHVDTFTFTSSDFLTDIIVAKNSYKTLIVKANVAATITGVTDLLLTEKDAATYMKFIGQDSGTAYDVATDLVGDLTLDITSPFAGGKFSFEKDTLEVKKASTSPSGAVSRGTIATYAIWDVTNMSSDQTAFDIDTFKVTSKTGLPSGILDADNNASGDQLFSLYDGEGNLIAGGAAATGETAIVQASGTVTFTKADMMTVSAGLPKQLVLKITTTNTALWPSNTQLQWSIEAVGDITSTVGKPGFGGTTWSIPATTNIVTLP